MSFYGLLVAISAVAALSVMGFNSYYANASANLDSATLSYANTGQMETFAMALQGCGCSYNALLQETSAISAPDGLVFYNGSGYFAITTTTLPRKSLVYSQG